MGRFTVAALREGIKDFNADLESAGIRLVVLKIENSWQVQSIVDDCKGQVVGSGTAYQAYQGAEEYYNHQLKIKRGQDLRTVKDALSDILDGQSAWDLQQWTGLSLERCEEIFDLC